MKTIVSPIELLEPRIAPAVLTVLNTNDAGAGSLRQAILEANDPVTHPGADTIVFKPGVAGTILLSTGEMLITEKLSIKGPGANKVIIDANNGSRIFNIGDGTSTTDSPVRISGLAKIRGNVARDSGGAIFSTESLTLTKVLVSGNSARTGGGVSVDGFGSANTFVKISHSTITGNAADKGGGGLYLFAEKSVSITGSQVIGNSGQLGGGVSLSLGAEATRAKISKCVISGNSTTTADGGGLFLYEVADSTGRMVVSRCLVAGNTGGADGGGIGIQNGRTVIKQTSVINNSGTSGGGIVGIDFDSISIVASKITGNRATESNSYGGGGHFERGSDVKIAGTVISGNTAKFGGGISTLGTGSEAVNLRVIGGEVSGNTGQSGGGIFTSGDGTVLIKGARILANSASMEGGGAFLLSSSSISIIGAVIANNSSETTGGGCALKGAAELTIKGSAFSGNLADTGGGLFLQTVHGSINHTKLVGNAALSNGGGLFSSGAAITFGGNVITGNVAPTNPDTNV